FGYLPGIYLTCQYKELAVLLNKTNMKVEQSAGLHINYNHPELGMNKRLLTVCKENNVSIITASDAHKPEDVGRFVREMSSG
ncbi:MAG: histidinol phosphate phosphatase, partial [Firmicutes bacterium]|nr:histidinol phosphate phosphatase [Bacillota bacterium]